MESIPAPVSTPIPAPAPAGVTPGADFAQRLLQEHRIHVEGGSFLGVGGNPMLTIHRAELEPKNEAALLAKMAKIDALHEPSWIASPQRLPILNALSQLLPLSRETRLAVNLREQQKLAEEALTGKNPDIARLDARAAKPFAGQIQQLLEEPRLLPEHTEILQNSVGLYLLLEKALEKRQQSIGALLGDLPPQASFSAEQMFARLQPALPDLDFQAISKAARDSASGPAGQGLEAVGKALGVDGKYIGEVKALVAHLPTHRFSASAVEGWKIGRQLPGMADFGIHEKITAGLEVRRHQVIHALRQQVKGVYQSPPGIEQQERLFAGKLGALPAELLEAHYRLGTEFVSSSRPYLNRQPAGRLLGLHEHDKLHRDDVEGVYHIYAAGGQGPEKELDTIVHEAHHLVMPNFLSPTDIARMDALALADSQRLSGLKALLDRWTDTNTPAEEKAAIEQQVETRFAVEGKPFSKIRGQADMNTLCRMVGEAVNNLTSESGKLILSGYGSAESRFAEITSRYAGLRHVRLREQPELLKFIVPGLTEAYEQVYLPHIHRAVEALRTREQAMHPFAPQQAAASQIRVTPAPSPAGMPPMTGDVEGAGTSLAPALPADADLKPQTMIDPVTAALQQPPLSHQYAGPLLG